eukprot:289382-Chlamydomonas_euryale.AAC.2
MAAHAWVCALTRECGVMHAFRPHRPHGRKQGHSHAARACGKPNPTLSHVPVANQTLHCPMCSWESFVLCDGQLNGSPACKVGRARDSHAAQPRHYAVGALRAFGYSTGAYSAQTCAIEPRSMKSVAACSHTLRINTCTRACAHAYMPQPCICPLMQPHALAPYLHACMRRSHGACPCPLHAVVCPACLAARHWLQ